MKKLIDAVSATIKKKKKDGIVGWGLNCLQLNGKVFGELVQVGPSQGCISDTCNHVSHSPAAPMMKWIPPEGWELSRLGDDDRETWYYLVSPEDEEFMIKFMDNHPYHDRLEWADFDDMPEWLLAQLEGSQLLTKQQLEDALKCGDKGHYCSNCKMLDVDYEYGLCVSILANTVLEYRETLERMRESLQAACKDIDKLLKGGS